MEKVLYVVGDLPAAARTAVETLMGRSLRDDQRVVIVALEAAAGAPDTDRAAAWRGFQESMIQMRENARHANLAPAEIERLIDEACEEVRYGTKPCG